MSFLVLLRSWETAKQEKRPSSSCETLLRRRRFRRSIEKSTGVGGSTHPRVNETLYLTLALIRKQNLAIDE